MKNEILHRGLDKKSGQFAKGNQLHTLRENVGRPPKASRFVEALKSVLADPHPVGMAIIHTDSELLRLVNRKLDKKDRIGEGTFLRFKKGDIKDHDDLQDFRELYDQALCIQANNLFEKLVDEGEKRSWQRYAWIIERKFDQWNLRTKSVDETPDIKQLVMRVVEKTTAAEKPEESKAS